MYQFTSWNRPDMMCRLFKIKLDQLIRDIKKGDIFGKVKSGTITTHLPKHPIYYLQLYSALLLLIIAHNIVAMFCSYLHY